MKKSKQSVTVPIEDGAAKANRIIEFLRMLMPVTLAKRIVALILLLAGVDDSIVVTLSGFSPRTVWGLRNKLQTGVDIGTLLIVRGGKGARSKIDESLEDAIIAELEANNYHTRQQIADMIQEKFGLTVSVWAVGRFLKKRVTGN